MSLFDPYSHTRIVELRQEQLARKAKRRSQLGLDGHSTPRRHALAGVLSAVTTRFGRSAKPAATPGAAPAQGRPALDS